MRPGGLSIVDLSASGDVTADGTQRTTENAGAVAVATHQSSAPPTTTLAAVVSTESLLELFDVSTPSAPRALGLYRDPGREPTRQLSSTASAGGLVRVRMQERPAELGDRGVLTTDEVAALGQRAANTGDRPPTPGNVGSYNSFWVDSPAAVAEGRRTSIIIDPLDGRLPPLVSGVVRQVGSYMENWTAGERPVRYRGGGLYPEGPEDRGLAERCLVGFNAGPPVLPGGYNQNVQIFQTADYVVLFHGEVGPRRTEGARAEPLRFPYRKVMETSGATSFLFEGETRPELRMLFDDYADPGSVSVALRALGLPPARGRQPEASTITGYRWDRGSFEWEDYSQGHLTVRRSDRPQREAICVWKITIRPREEAR